MLETEAQWAEALARNNIRVIIRWLWKLTAEDEGDTKKTLHTFSCWVQRTSEFARKELLTLCFSRCQGLWMILDRSSFVRVHMLLQRLRNLLTLAQWAKKQIPSAHLCHGMEIPCVHCRDTSIPSDMTLGCWNREHRALKKHIWLGQLVQWWGIMGLLPKYPEPHEMKRISQMWKEIANRHRQACPEKPGRSSFIQGMVTHLDHQHGCVWTFENYTDQCYPPPNLQALLKLVLMPRVDIMSVQAIIMYFILDMADFLQCKDDLLQSFSFAFAIPPSFSQQIRAFWMLDHGHIKASVELLLSPRAAAPWLSWQHRYVIHRLLTAKQPLLALRYLRSTGPAIESAEDAKLCADVLLQNSCVSEAWAVLKRCTTETDDATMCFVLFSKGLGLNAEALKYIPAECNHDRDNVSGIETTASQLSLVIKEYVAEIPPCPLSAKLNQAQTQNTMSSEELIRLVREAVMEARRPQPKISAVVWPEHTDRNSREMFLSTQALCRVTPSPSPMDMIEETAHTDEPEEEQPALHNPQSHEHNSSNEDLGSISSWTSASSLPLLRRCYHYVYESTQTLKRISSLLTDEENQNRDDTEEEESRTPSSVNMLAECPDPVLTPDGTTDPISHSNLNKDILEELVLSADEEYVKAGVSSSEDLPSVEVSATNWENGKMGEMRPPDERLTVFPSSSAESATSGCFLVEDPQQKDFELHLQEKSLARSSQDLHCTISGTTQNLLTDLRQSLLLQEPTDATLGVLADKRRPSSVQSQLFSCSLVNFMDIAAKQKGDNRNYKQEDKDKIAGWTSFGKTSQGAIRSGRTRLKQSKRVKRA